MAGKNEAMKGPANKVVLKKTNVLAQCMQIIFIEAKS